ncbi:MAG TPA: uridine diphosphate-N-acetylglucosamine-binding protein YvcK [Candidatus Saccharimonadales bacterium]|nr:uridine diphosphate-N-acetylglucosamine-binding protein YvcK [Candidatus Saccharimonadales bacterium]
MIDKPKIVILGGGSGLSTLLRGLKYYPVSLSGIVAMADNGASSGRLSRELGVLPPGDVRKCLAALSDDEELLTKLFEYRFQRGRGISGHALGNLLLLALTDLTGSFEKAVQASSRILAIRGQVIPSTLQHVSIVAHLKNGQQALGETEIPIQGHRFGIETVTILPDNAQANPTATHFIENADLLIFGPGSLFTSVVPNLLIQDIRRAVEKSSAQKIYVCNVSTERGETEKLSVEDHVKVVAKHLGRAKLDKVIVNNKTLIRSSNSGKLGSICNITDGRKTVQGVSVVSADVIDPAQPLFHDPKRLAEVIWQVFTKP